MAHTTDRSAQFGAAKGPLSYFASLWTAMTEARARRASYRQTLNELQALSDRELADIGLARCDIRRLAREELLKD
ncbi:DUF1127 domain-containing protein [Sulfitobacter sp. PS-8MA]|uniref:DUF1127 domain-containing protein n=1 Tax=Sulfitobacter sp. PS-8MA TaxID=3237707 RepID=UPI0034C636E6